MIKLSVIFAAVFLIIPLYFCLGQDELRIAELKEQLNSNIHDTTRLNAYLELTKEYKKGEIDLARTYGKRALELAVKLHLEDKEVLAYYLLAETYCKLYELDSVILMVDRGRKILTEAKAMTEPWGLLNHVESAVHTLEGRYDKAMELLNQSRQIFTNLNNECSLASTFNRIAIIYVRNSTYDSAVYYFIESNRNFSICGDSSSISVTLMNIGTAYSKLKEYYKALHYYKQAEKILQRVKKKGTEAEVYNGIGKCLLMLKKYDSAIVYFNKSLNLYDSIGLLNKYGGYIYISMGTIYQDLKNYDKALEYFNMAHQIAVEINDSSKIVNAKKNLAVLYERQGDYHRALKIYDTCLMIAKRFEDNSSIVHTYFNIFRTWELIGDYKQAYEYQEIYNYWRDSIFNLEKAEIISELEIKYETEKNQAKILALNNESLIKDLAIKKKNSERNTAIILGVGVITILILLFIMFLWKVKKDRIIKEKEIQRLNEEKKALAAKSLLYGQEEERKRLARELHDGIGVLLSSVKMQFTNYIDKNPENTNLLVKATSALDEASNDIRRISHNMMPGILTKLGLSEAIRDLMEDVNETTGILAECQIMGITTRLAENVEIMIFRIIQELVNNVLKHARASQVSLIINRLEDETRIQFSDNGQGFNVNEVLAKKTMGIQSIQSRVHFLGGEVSIESNSEKGSIFIIVIPKSKS